MRAPVAVKEAVRDALVRHAVETWPRECCGLLIGTAASVEQARRARNLADGETAFRIDPADHVAAIRAARRVGWKVVGVYHSHPNGRPTPSPRDIDEATVSDDLYVIVAITPPGQARVHGYRLRPGGYEAVDLIVRRGGRGA